MDNESEVIRHQMEETRTALQDKLETLEEKVKDTVQTATEAVSTVKETVQETVGSVKDTVQETVATVKESVQDTVDSVKDTLDVRQQVERHPWAMFFGAAALGFIGGRLLHRALDSAAAPRLAPPAYEPPLSTYRAAAVPPPQAPAAPPAPPPAPQRSWLDVLTENYGPELQQIKGLALGAVGGLVREMVVESAPPALADQLKEVVDGVTRKLGGEPLQGPLFTGSPRTSEERTTGNGRHDEEEAGGAIGAAPRHSEAIVGRFDL